jgi:hypothetical protein
MPLASLERPFRAFPSRGAVPALAGLLLPCGFALRPPPAQCLQEIRDRFRVRCQLFAARARPKADPGRMSRDERSSRSLVRSPRRTRRRAARAVPFLLALGSPVRGRHARFEALLPPGVRSATTPSPGQAEAARRCSPGVLSLQSSLHYGSGFGLSRQRTQGALNPSTTCTTGRPAVAVAFRDPDSDAWAREPRIRRCAESRELRTPPSSGDPAHQAPRERFRAPAASPVPRPAGR